MYLQKVISRKNCVKNYFFAGMLIVNYENNRIRIQDQKSEAWIRGSGSGSTPKCHGSGTLASTTVFTGQAFETWSAGTQTSFGLDVNTDGNNCKGKKWRDILKGALLRLSLEGFSWILERFKVEDIYRKIIASLFCFLQKTCMDLDLNLYVRFAELDQHCKETVPKIGKNISRKETARPQSQFLRSYTLNSNSICERFKYSPDWSAYLAAAK